MYSAFFGTGVQVEVLKMTNQRNKTFEGMRQALLFTVLGFFLAATRSLAQEVPSVPSVPSVASSGDTLEVLFQTMQSDLDLSYADNSYQLDAFVARIVRQNALGDVSLNVYAGASPEGPAELNRRLGERRGVAIRQALTERLTAVGLNSIASRITVVNLGGRWADLYKMISRSDAPWRDEALEILGRQPHGVGEWQTDPRETALRELRGGSAWIYIASRYLPRLRSVGSAVIVHELPALDCDTLVIHDTIYYMPEPLPVPTKKYCPQQPRRLHTTLRTNLLYLLTATPNLSVDFGMARRWSASLTLGYNPFKYPARQRDDNKTVNPKTYHWLVMPELRFWFREHLEGCYLGLYGQYARYDVGGISFIPALNDNRYDGYLYGGGVSVGWHWWLGRKHRTGLEASVGVGYLRLHYDKYRACKCSGLLETVDKNFFGPTKLAVSLVYVIK